MAESSGTTLFRPAARAHTPVLVGTGRLLSSANSLNAFTDGAVRLIGGPLGAVLLTVAGFDTLVCVDAATYLASAAAILASTRRPARTHPAGFTVRDVLTDLLDGLRVLRHDRFALPLLPITNVFLAANASLSAVLVPFGVTTLGGSEPTGVLLSGLGIGFLIGAPTARAFVDRVQPKYLLAGSQALTAAGFLALFHSSSLPLALPAAASIDVFGSLTLITPQTAIQRLIPNAALGRVSAVFFTGEAAASLLGALIGPMIAQTAGLTINADIAGTITLAAAVLAFTLLPRSPNLTPAHIANASDRTCAVMNT